VAEAERSAQRQELLVNVWKASAAVVDQVLGREDATAINPAAESQATAARQLLEQPALPWPVMPPEALASVARVSFPLPADVVAYDQRGHSSLAPLEPGALISRRV
jgi:tryptophan 2,3-dioxygenase